jgi:hypothetical protein
MKIIILIGEKNQGKSCALHLVYEKLITDNGKGVKTELLGDESRADSFYIVNCKNKKIAIYTKGDYQNDFPDAKKKAEKENCDILICACNQKEKESIDNDKPDHIIIEKTIESSLFPKFEANLFDCYQILKCVLTLIKT